MDGKPLEVHNTPFTPLRGRVALRGREEAPRLFKLGVINPRGGAGAGTFRFFSSLSSLRVLSPVKLQRLARCTGVDAGGVPGRRGGAQLLHRQHRRRSTLVKDAARLVSDPRRHRCVGAYHELC